MCGRYELKAKARALNRHFPQLHLSQGEMPQTGEIHPTDTVLIITTGNSTGTGYLAAKARWGLVGSFLDHAPRPPCLARRCAFSTPSWCRSSVAAAGRRSRPRPC